MLCQRKVSLKAKFLIGLPYFYFCQCCFIQLPLISHLVDCCYNKKLIHAGFYSWFCQFRGFRYLIYMLLLLHLRNGEVCLLDLGGFRLFFFTTTLHILIFCLFLFSLSSSHLLKVLMQTTFRAFLMAEESFCACHFLNVIASLTSLTVLSKKSHSKVKRDLFLIPGITGKCS